MASIAVASDLHCHALAGGRQAESFLTTGLGKTPWRANPVESLKRRIADSNLRAEVLLSPGDLGNKCSQEGMTYAWTAIHEIGEALNVASVIATLGNHDVDSRRTNGPDPFAPARAIATSFPLTNDAQAGEYWAKHFCLIDEDDLRLLVINSVASHSNEEEAKHGAIKDATIELIEEALDRAPGPAVRVALVHHHPHPHEDIGLGAEDLMHGGQNLLDLLGKRGFALVVHGHKHHPKLSYAQGGANSPVVFAAGSLTHINHGELASNTRNLFHLIDLRTTQLAHCTVEGTIRSWEFNFGGGWNPATTKSAGFPWIAGFGCRSTHNDMVGYVLPQLNPGLSQWGTLEAAVPQLRYVLPQDKVAVLRVLQEQHGVEILYGDDGEPALLRKADAEKP